jgi:hypothetical protein
MSIFEGVVERNFVTVFIPLPNVKVLYSQVKTLFGARVHQPDRFVNNFGEGEQNRCSA